MKHTFLRLFLYLASFALCVSVSALTAHTTTEFDSYVDETDNTQNVSVVTYDQRQYEIYAFIKGKDAPSDGNTIYGLAAIDDNGHIKILGSSTNKAATLTASWITATTANHSGESTSYDKEFTAFPGSTAIATYQTKDVTADYVQLATGTIEMVVKGYDQFDVCIEDEKDVTKTRYINVSINGSEASDLDGYAYKQDKKVYRFALDPTKENTIVIRDMVNSTSNQSKLGAFFSLRRIPQIVQKAQITIGSNTYDADIVNGTDVHYTVSYADWRDYVNNGEKQTPELTLIKDGEYKNPSDKTTPRDFSTPQAYEFIYTDGRTYPYTITIEPIPASTANAILSYDYAYSLGSGNITRFATVDTTAGVITVTLPYSMSPGKPNYDLSKSITTNFTWSPLATLTDKTAFITTPTETLVSASGNIDYTADRQVVITSESGEVQKYTIKVDYDEPQHGYSITDFELYDAANTNKLDQTVSINEASGTINITVGNVDLTNLTPHVTASEMATVSGSYVNFSSPVVYTVDAECDDASHVKKYTVTVTKDTQKPTMTVETPADNATEVSLAGKITVSFDEPCKLGTSGAKVTINGTGKPNEDLSATVEQIDETTFTFKFSGLTSLETYTLSFEEGFFTDLYGNRQAAKTTTFTCADGTLHTADYVSEMDGDNFPQPAFVLGVYNEKINVRASSRFPFGAYEVKAGESLTITTDPFAAMLDIKVYSLATAGSFTITDDGTALAGNIGTNAGTGLTSSGTEYSFSNYDNRGYEINVPINGGQIKLNNTSSSTLYIPFFSIISGYDPTEEKETCSK